MPETNEIPEGWVDTPLEKLLFSLESGSRPKGGVRGIKGGIPSIGGEHLNDNGGFRFEKVKYVPLEFYNKMNKGAIAKNDILIVKDGATTGKVSIVKDNFPFSEAVVNEHVFLCRLFPYISPEYVFYFLYSELGQKRILDNFRGSAQGGINKGFAPNTEIPLPPLPEQHRIVSAIEAIFSRLDAAEARLERVPEIMKQFRQSVLAAACDGRLTEDWRVENPDVEKLFENKDNNKINTGYFQIPEKWVWKSLKEISLNSDYGTSVKCDYEFKGFPVLRIPNISNGKIEWDDLKYSNPEETFPESKFLKENDLLIIRTNGSKELIGKAALYKESKLNKVLFASYLIRYQLINNEILSQWVFSIWHSEFIRDWIKNQASSSAGQHNISVSKLNNLLIPLPPLPEQQEIVRRVDALFSLADKIEERYTIAKERTEKLRQSVLAQAFSGRLVETEAEIARREGRSYESAAELLERVRGAE